MNNKQWRNYMDIINNSTAVNTRMFNQQQIQRNHAAAAQQKLRQEVIQRSSPDDATLVKPRSQAVMSDPVRSRYMFAIGDDGRRILRLQIDLKPSSISVLA